MSEWPHYYYKLLLHLWHNMSPMEYGGVLIAIAVVGYLLMKSGSGK